SGVGRVLVVRRLNEGAAADVPFDARRDRWWHEAVASVSEEDVRQAEETDPETPFMVIYTSGTTGAPKGTVHVHGGFPIKATQDLAHTSHLRRAHPLLGITDRGLY